MNKWEDSWASQQFIPTKKLKKEKKKRKSKMGQHAFVPTFLNKVRDRGGGAVLVEWCAYSDNYILLELFWHSDLLFVQLLKILTLGASPCQLKRLFKNHFYGVFNLFNSVHNLCKKTGPSFHRELTSNVFESKSEGKL